jgi:hypothetical protein
MAILTKQPEGTCSILLSRHLVGRSRLAALRMTEPTVSGEHAVLRWTGREWELHDLGSRNGTTVDGRRLNAGERVALSRGALITFGQADNAWQLTDDSAPTILAVPVEGGEPAAARNDLLALPSDDDPQAVIYRDAKGDWMLEQAGAGLRITDQYAFRVGGRDFTIRVPDLTAPTWDGSAGALHLEALSLRFQVSRDEEYVALTARSGGKLVDLGARAHHLVLLMLARSRLEDRARRAQDPTLQESAEGWVYQDDLAKKLGMDETHLNVAVFRCRRQLGEAGIAGAANIVERRRPTRELRLGVKDIEVITV